MVLAQSNVNNLLWVKLSSCSWLSSFLLYTHPMLHSEISLMQFLFCDMAQPWASMINKKNYMQSSSTTGKVTAFFLASVMLTLDDLRRGEG